MVLHHIPKSFGLIIKNKISSFASSCTSVKRRHEEVESHSEEEDDDYMDEYDEDDDFIDDGGCADDVSQHIRNIFGYDKRK